MALSYTREYKRIIEELAVGIMRIHDFYEVFQMDESDWKELSEDEKFECAKTFADDAFYSLGKNPSLNVVSAVLDYDKAKALITISERDLILCTINL